MYLLQTAGCGRFSETLSGVWRVSAGLSFGALPSTEKFIFKGGATAFNPDAPVDWKTFLGLQSNPVFRLRSSVLANVVGTVGSGGTSADESLECVLLMLQAASRRTQNHFLAAAFALNPQHRQRSARVLMKK